MTMSRMSHIVSTDHVAVRAQNNGRPAVNVRFKNEEMTSQTSDMAVMWTGQVLNNT